MQPSREIHRADLAYRRRSLWLLAATVLVCAIGLWHWHEWLLTVRGQIVAGPPEHARRWLARAIVLMLLAPVLPLLGWGRGLRRMGRAARVQGRFPPRDWKTYRDVSVLRERAALDWSRRSERLGRLAQNAAGLLVAAALAVWLWLN
ncbi:MAG: hypothetical protein JF591_09910 [Lysobacter sp.]|nr:hypothetical protein [Lysobacter sp.]